jgi:hypothetical protein
VVKYAAKYKRIPKLVTVGQWYHNFSGNRMVRQILSETLHGTWTVCADKILPRLMTDE